jgi:hypothetical protein
MGKIFRLSPAFALFQCLRGWDAAPVAEWLRSGFENSLAKQQFSTN